MHASKFVTFFTLLTLSTAGAAEKYELPTAAAEGQTYRTRVSIKVGGNLTVRDLETKKSQPADQVRKLPMSVVGKLDYEEQQLSTQHVARYYGKAQATIKVDKGGKTPQLPDNLRLIVAKTGGDRLQLGSPDGPLTREQLDLVDVLGATPYIDQLLPTEAVAEGESWQVGPEVMGPLLGLDSVSVCEVSNVVDEGNEAYVKFQLAGTVHGRVEGADTEFELRGLGLYSRKNQCVTQLNLAAKEKRALGPATPGFEGVAKVNVKRTPIETAEKLDNTLLAKAGKGSIEENLLLPTKGLGCRLRHDRGWYVAGTSSKSLSMRRIENGSLIAQATFTGLPSKTVAANPTLDKFESNIRTGLTAGTQIVSSEQWTTRQGNPCLTVIARGKVQDLELEYRHYLVLPAKEGPSISLTVTLAVDDMAKVGAADRMLADAVELIGNSQSVANKPTTTK